MDENRGQRTTQCTRTRRVLFIGTYVWCVHAVSSPRDLNDWNAVSPVQDRRARKNQILYKAKRKKKYHNYIIIEHNDDDNTYLGVGTRCSRGDNVTNADYDRWYKYNNNIITIHILYYILLWCVRSITRIDRARICTVLQAGEWDNGSLFKNRVPIYNGYNLSTAQWLLYRCNRIWSCPTTRSKPRQSASAI